jgi:hypothetical protein
MSDESLDGLLASLRKAGSQAVVVQAEKVVKKAAVQVKKGWIANAKQSVAGAGHARAYPYSITFDDPVRGPGHVEVEVGPDKNRRQGALGNLIEYGSVNNPPHWDGKRAAEAEAPAFEQHLADMGGAIVASTDFWTTP